MLAEAHSRMAILHGSRIHRPRIKVNIANEKGEGREQYRMGDKVMVSLVDVSTRDGLDLSKHAVLSWLSTVTETQNRETSDSVSQLNRCFLALSSLRLQQIALPRGYWWPSVTQITPLRRNQVEVRLSRRPSSNDR